MHVTLQRFFSWWIVCLLVGACATQPASDAGPDAEGLDSPLAIETLPAPTASRKPVAIIVSDDSAQYVNVAATLTVKLGRDATKYSLTNASGAVIADLIRAQGISNIVAVGLKAALSVKPSDGFNVIYCQVFEEAELQALGYRGVAALPPYALQLDYWQSEHPQLSSIGVIASVNLRYLVDDLRHAAAERGINLIYSEVDSDQQAWSEFQRMVPDIDGFVYLPDAQILSPQSIQKIMNYAAKHRTSMLTYLPAIANLGGSFAISANTDDVANAIVAMLDHQPEVPRLPLTTFDLLHSGR